MINGGKILVTRHSAFQTILVTEDEAGLRTLRFGSEGALQSVVKVGAPRHLELSYARVLPGIHAALFAGLENATLHPVIAQEIPLAEAPRAHREVMAPGALGKIVMIP